MIIIKMYIYIIPSNMFQLLLSEPSSNWRWLRNWYMTEMLTTLE